MGWAASNMAHGERLTLRCRRTPARITAQRRRIVVETAKQAPTLAAMLAAFDPKRHCGEVMAFAPVGLELIDRDAVSPLQKEVAT